MRTLNSAKNLASSLGITILMTFLGFVTRKIFVDEIGVEYLGLNGLLQNVLGIMTLLEGGFAASVVYNMYKPVAEDDRPKILALLQLYKKIYIYIACGVIAFGLLMYPFIDVIIKDADNLDYVSVVYFIFLFNSVIGYFTAYKWSLINVSQQNYKLTVVNLVYQVGLNLSKLAILYYTKNYIAYLVVEALFGVGLNWAIVKKADSLFPYIKTKKKYVVDKATKENIITNMKALFLNKIGGFFMHGTDNIIISAFVGVATIGLYSNYTLIVGVVKSVACQALNSFSESVGNLIATESSEKIYGVFKVTFLVNFIVASVPVIVLHNTLTPFVKWWLGNQFTLGYSVLCVILANFYIDLMRETAMMYKNKAGIFVKDRFTPLIQGCINLALSYIFVQFWGLFGVLLATSISLLSIAFWQMPRLCYKYVFAKPLKLYFERYALYSLMMVACTAISYGLCSMFESGNLFVNIVVDALISLLVVVGIYYVCLFRKAEFTTLMTYVKTLRSR